MSLCEICGEALKRTGARRHKDCDTQAKTIGDVPHVCPGCGTDFMARGNQKFCSTTCRDETRYQRIKADPELYQRFTQGYKRDPERYQRYLAARRRYDKANPARRRRQAYRRGDRRDRGRAAQLGVDATRIDRAAIFERDGWRCQVHQCLFRSRAINRELRWPHPASVTLDHIIPLSKGGTHTRENVQTAHARCNVAKADGGMDQLRLV